MDYEDLIYIPESLGNSLARTQVAPGDIVISQRGSLGQCAIIDNAFKKLNISANIIAVKNIRDISAMFVHDYILSSIGQTLLERNTSGQVQKKITTQDIADILIPIGCDESKLSCIIQTSYSLYKNKIDRIGELISLSPRTVTDAVGLTSCSNKKLYFAIHLMELDGVIDVKRYMSSRKNEYNLLISNICEVIDKKINPTRYSEQLIDWIRIDDLPNQPLDIEETRTQQANTIEGTFFEVQEGDILVARLGPTILNQKIVMVRSIKRTTIASAEFLVLRCKPEYNPEAVMAVLKTDYYKELMYSHARGSTPSRYRLNREDMLTLPFPDIRGHQEQIAVEAKTIREQVIIMRIQAEQEWQAAKAQFEKELLGE